MAHFAQLDEKNIVMQVIVVDNKELIGTNGIESEEHGIQFCKNLFGQHTNWLQTSYNNNIRNRYAVIGGKYDQQKNAFLDKQPYWSWILNEETLEWIAPIKYPDDGRVYDWDELNKCWVLKILNSNT
jgi:hypothetical protein